MPTENQQTKNTRRFSGRASERGGEDCRGGRRTKGNEVRRHPIGMKQCSLKIRKDERNKKRKLPLWQAT